MCLSQPGDDTISMSLCSIRIDQYVLFIDPNMYESIVYISVICVTQYCVRRAPTQALECYLKSFEP